MFSAHFAKPGQAQLCLLYHFVEIETMKSHRSDDLESYPLVSILYSTEEHISRSSIIYWIKIHFKDINTYVTNVVK